VQLGDWGFTPDGYFSLRLRGAVAPTYVIESSSDLRQWLPISTNSPVGGEVDFADRTSKTDTQRYYRARSGP
jgi:hypothetical protein